MDDIGIIGIFRICRTARCSSGCSTSGHDEDGWKQAGRDQVHLGGCAIWRLVTKATSPTVINGFSNTSCIDNGVSLSSLVV
jgi:hypothetical protein